MASRKRQWTDYPGVFYVETSRKGKSGKEKVYYIMYRRNGKQIEEKAGHQYKDDMTPARASRLRGERMEGDKSNKERREAQKIENKKPTLDRLWLFYEQAHENQSSHPDDLSRYRKHLAPVFGDKTPDEIISADVDKLRLNLLLIRSPQTVKHVLSLLRRILNYAVHKLIIPAPNHLQFEMPKVDNQKTEMLTVEQMNHFLEALDTEADQVAAAGVRLALVTGMRHGAICALRWNDVDFEREFIVLRGETAKSGRTERIPMSKAARTVLDSIPHQGEYVFPGKKPGTHRTTFRRVASRARDTAGLPSDFRSMHGLRHAYASFLASSGKVDQYTLQKLMTHTKPEMTQRYAHLTDRAMQRAAGVLDEIMGSIDQQNLPEE